MAEAMIFDIQKNSYVDGPGIRTAVFFKGCNLRCKWCHNPEGISPQPQLLFYKERCSSCGLCREVCPHHLEGKCTLCGTCAFYCLQEARRLCGRKYTAKELFKEIERDRAFYRASGGGVTFSGGECMLQADFLEEMLKLCRGEGIHTAVDTAGAVPWAVFERIHPLADMFLYDVKCFSERLHVEGTGVSNAGILSNLKRLSHEAAGEIIVRIPVIAGFNDSMEEMGRIADFLRPLRIRNVELLPCHSMGRQKYLALGLPFENFTAPPEEKMALFRTLFAE